MKSELKIYLTLEEYNAFYSLWKIINGRLNWAKVIIIDEIKLANK